MLHEYKNLIGPLLILASIGLGVLLATFFHRVRDGFFALMIFLAPLTERWDVNFVSRDFYRGTSRGFEVSLVDVLSISLLLSSILAPRRGQSRAYWPASLGLMILFFCYACFNVAIADPKLFGLFELSKMVRGIIIFMAVAFYLRSERELRFLILGLALAICCQGLLALQQRYVYGIHRVYGTVDDSNSLSVFLCIVAPVLVAAINSPIPKFLKLLCSVAVALACVGVILTISRAGVVIIALVLLGAAAFTMSLRLTARKVIIGCIVLLGVTGVLAKSWKTLAARMEETNFTAEYGNNKNLGRGYYLRIARAIVDDQLFGVGLNNWSYWVSQKYGPKLGYRFIAYSGTDREPRTVLTSENNVDRAQAAPAHNLGALMAGELGLPGLFLFLLLWVRWFQMAGVFLWKGRPDLMRRMGIGIFFALSGLFLASLTEWVFRHSPLYYIIHILLGALASLYYVRRQSRKAERLAQELPEEPDAYPAFSKFPGDPIPAGSV